MYYTIASWPIFVSCHYRQSDLAPPTKTAHDLLLPFKTTTHEKMTSCLDCRCDSASCRESRQEAESCQQSHREATSGTAVS